MRDCRERVAGPSRKGSFAERDKPDFPPSLTGIVKAKGGPGSSGAKRGVCFLSAVIKQKYRSALARRWVVECANTNPNFSTSDFDYERRRENPHRLKRRLWYLSCLVTLSFNRRI